MTRSILSTASVVIFAVAWLFFIASFVVPYLWPMHVTYSWQYYLYVFTGISDTFTLLWLILFLFAAIVSAIALWYIHKHPELEGKKTALIVLIVSIVVLIDMIGATFMGISHALYQTR